jgi:hypothetical protein
VNVGGDLARIGREFGAGESIAMRNKETIINLGQCARKRDVVQSGAVRLKELIKIVLGFHVDKSADDTFSNWNADDLTPQQVKYALFDVDASLRVYDKLRQKPDLTARLTMEDIVVGKIVDLVPRNGSVACMATRAASGIIVDDIICDSLPGITQKKVRAGQGMVTIKLEKVYSPSLQIPYYTRSGAREKPTLAEFGLGKIVVPVQMLKDHVNSGSIRITETAMIGHSQGITIPSENDVLDTENNTRSHLGPFDEGSKEPANLESHTQNHALSRLGPFNKFFNDPADLESHTQNREHDLESQIQGDNAELNLRDIELLRAAIIEGAMPSEGRTPLQCNEFSTPPKPDEIVDVYSPVLGDVFHAMNRAYVPVKHVAKKSYFVALQNAFFVCNESKFFKLRRFIIFFCLIFVYVLILIYFL